MFLTNDLKSLKKKIEVSIATILSFTFEFTAGEFVLYIIIMFIINLISPKLRAALGRLKEPW